MLRKCFPCPGVLPLPEKRGLKGLRSYDVAQGWNFLDAKHRKKCLDEIEHYKPECVVVSPPCGPFSTLQACSLDKQDPEQRNRKMIEARVLLGFAMQVCEMQHKAGRIFVFEQPVGATSWKEVVTQKIEKLPGVFTFNLDQCMFGLKDPLSQVPYKKRTRLMTNCEEMKRLKRDCDQLHEHQHVQGQTRVGGRLVNRSRCAQVYPKELIEQMIVAYKKHRNRRGHEILAAETLQEDRTDLERSVRRCHVNLGHPSKERFIHMLRSAGASARALESAKQLRCSVCSVHKPSPSHAVSKHKRAEGFNQQINMDTFDLPIYQGKVLKMLNIVCEGTGFQVCTPLWKGCNVKEVRFSYRKCWKRWAGNPVKVFTDGGTEFDNMVQQGFENDGVYVEKTAAYSPWQAGYVERHGGIWKTDFSKAFEECQPASKMEVSELIDQVNVAKNTMMRKHGYAPVQHVFGCDIRLPSTLLDDQPDIAFNSGVIHGDHQALKANQIRVAARKALIEVDNSEKVRRALEHRSRVSRGKEFEVGDYVYYWRKVLNKNGTWKGPARVIGFYEGRSKIWVSVGNKVLRCAPEQLRRLTSDQEAAIRFVTADMVDARRRLSERGAHVFTDISQEEKPPSGDGGIVDENGDLQAEMQVKRRRVGDIDNADEHPVPSEEDSLLRELLQEEGAIDEPNTDLATEDAQSGREMTEEESMREESRRNSQNETGETPEVNSSSNSYGPIRECTDRGATKKCRTTGPWLIPYDENSLLEALGK